MKTRAEKIAAAEAAGIVFPYKTPPEPGQVIKIAPGILWAQLPLPMALNHINIYLMEDDDGWTVIDTGMDTPPGREAWEALLSGPLSAKPVKRVLITHHHPDHIGLAGWLCERFDAVLLASRTGFLFGKMLQLDAWEALPPAAEQYYLRAGYGEREMEVARWRAKFSFGKVTAPMPVGFQRVAEGSVLHLAGRDWDVHYGHGHAPDHLVLVSKDKQIVIAGDQVLPRITSVVGVYPTEPEGDPLGDWLASCRDFERCLPGGAMILPGHNEPFTGVNIRLRQLVSHHEEELDKVLAFLRDKPRSAIECFEVMFDRKITDGLLGFATSEALAHLNHLVAQGRATRSLADEHYLYAAAAEKGE